MKVLTLKYPVNAVTDFLLSLLCVFCIILIFQFDGNIKTEDVASYSTDAVSFLENYGWEVVPGSEEISMTELPLSADDVFARYNKLQLEQGFDLTPYLGKKLVKYSYLLTETPFESIEGDLYATVLLYEGKIVGADVYDPSLDGFMQGVVNN